MAGYLGPGVKALHASLTARYLAPRVKAMHAPRILGAVLVTAGRRFSAGGVQRSLIGPAAEARRLLRFLFLARFAAVLRVFGDIDAILGRGLFDREVLHLLDQLARALRLRFPGLRDLAA